MMDIDVLHAQVVRGSTKVPWGLHLQGGCTQPLIIAQISISSPAAKIGIQCGDRVTHVQGKSVTKMSPHDVIALMNQQGCTLLLTVERPVNVRQQQFESKQQIQISTPRTAPTCQSQNQTSVFKPRPPLWYTPPVKAQPRHTMTLASSSDLDDYQNGGALDDVMMNDRQETLSDVAMYSSGSLDEEQHPLQYEYQTVHAQPFSRPGRLTPRQRQNTVESRSSSEADQAVTTSSPHSFSSPCYSPTPNYSTPSCDTSAPSYQYGGDVIADSYDDRLPQSRTFRILQSLVFNDVPSSGDQALPPPRSASQEQRREEEAERRAGLTGGVTGPSQQRQRMRVFMPQQYNSPLRMYSAPNIINTFQDQAEKYFESLERKNRQEQPNYAEDQGFYGY